MMYIIDNMTRTQIYLPENQYLELKQLATLQGVTFAQVVRDCIDEKLMEFKTQKASKKQRNKISMWLSSLKKVEKWKEKGIVRRGSIDHDKYLYSRKSLHNIK